MSEGDLACKLNANSPTILRKRIEELEAEVKRLQFLALKVCEYIDRCLHYGPADALLDWTQKLKNVAEAREDDGNLG